jgi:hypothetical protein
MRVFAVVVIGAPGSGKTSVLTALHDALADDDVAHAVIEVEALAWAHLPISDAQSFQHLASLCDAYKAAGCELFIVGATATSVDYLAGVVSAVEADEYLVVGLDADPRTLRKRIVAREPPEWSGLPQLLDAVDEIALTTRSLEGVELLCSTDEASPTAVAEQVRQARPDVLRGQIASL